MTSPSEDSGSPIAASNISLGRVHARRLRDMYRSAGWPCQDSVEVELLAAGLLERMLQADGQERLRLTDAGVQHLAQAFHNNRQAMSAHDTLVAHMAQSLLRDGRLVWTSLSVRARLPTPEGEPNRWKVCKPDVFSIRNSSVAAYLEPVVHEIKVSRADLLGDLKSKDKRDSYLDVGGQCWYVLGTDRKGTPIAEPEEIPAECGVMFFIEGKLEVARSAPKRGVPDLPFSLWMALAKSTPLTPWAADTADSPDQGWLTEPTENIDLASPAPAPTP